MHRPNVHYRPTGVRNAGKLVASLTFDVICSAVRLFAVASGVVSAQKSGIFTSYVNRHCRFLHFHPCNFIWPSLAFRTFSVDPRAVQSIQIKYLPKIEIMKSRHNTIILYFRKNFVFCRSIYRRLVCNCRRQVYDFFRSGQNPDFKQVLKHPSKVIGR